MADSQQTPKASVWSRYVRLPQNVLALSFVALLNDTSSEIIYPLLPAFLALTLGASPFAIGLIEGFAESIASILKLFSGYLSDRLNTRKWPVFLGYSLAAIMRPLLALVTSWPQVLVVRMGDRIGKGIRGAPRDALLAASVPASERGFAFGFNRAADHFGAILGPVIAYLLLSYFAGDPRHPTAGEFQSVFWFASLPVIFGLFVIFFFVKEEKITASTIAAPVKLTLRGFDDNFKRLLLVIAVFTLSNSTDAFLLLRAEQAGVSPAVLPLLWMALHFSKVGFSLIGGDLSDRVGRKKLIFAGWIVYAAVYLGFAFADSAWQAWTLFIVYGVYFGFTEGVEKAMVADLVGEERRGTAFGLYNLAFGIAVFPASLIFGLIWTQYGASTAFVVSSMISIAAAIFLLTVKTGPQTKTGQA
ncbi:MAG: MFS transporter [Pyrinomonadaceae bacterium]|nr:MFS transporter [Pyrinomonadaceae bacterium]MBP6211903.1 MFS transporter [Pyrinomonadaceae bacterium]